MAKDENGGLLSKVVRFVRNPATNWSDLDQAEQEREAGQNKLLLKEMVERKKNNDFVRKREFDILRKLRRREASDMQSPTLRPSLFQSSLPSKPDERALTIKKIDEIEAQMSMQWWKSKPRDAAQAAHIAGNGAPLAAGGVLPSQPVVPGRPLSSRTVPPLMTSTPPARSAPPVQPPALAPLPPLHAPAERPMLEPMSWSDISDLPPPVATTAPRSAPLPSSVAHQPQPTAAPRPAAPVPVAAPQLGFALAGSPNFSPTNSFGIEVGEIAHDPELEEASIRFANGDDAGAEAGLMDALSPNGVRVGHVETWLTLFDLHRATGRQASFDVAAMDFANRFQRSAPQWFSMPDMVDELVAAQPASAGSQAAHWSCPPLLSQKALGNLRDVLARTSAPWRLDWTRLSTLEPAVVPQLTQMFSNWADQPVEINLTAGDRLEQVLADGAPSGDPTVSPDWWHARLALLRVMSCMDDFELTALNYCVTYEVSPPSWEKPRCICKMASSDSVDRGGPVTIIGGPMDFAPQMSRESLHSDFHTTNIDSLLLPPMVVELSGSIAGDVTTTLQTLEAKFAGSDHLTLSCAKLIRVDFAAAGTLLNWVSALHTQGRQVQFKDVHRLIAGFFNVIGISDLSRVVVRTD